MQNCWKELAAHMEATYFANANNSGWCGDIELVSVKKICGHLVAASELIYMEL